MTTLIVTGGDAPTEELLRYYLKSSNYIIGVDGAADHFYRLGIYPDLLIGDFDTADPACVREIEKDGVKVIRLKAEKNETDTEAAVDYAISSGAEEIIILGALGSRLDHTIANIMMLVRADMSGVKARIIDKISELYVSNKKISINGSTGDTLSILPLTSEITVDASGLQYPLDSLKLCWGSSRGISNVIISDTAEITISGGYALIIKYNVNL
jgi:thiamine pyrophosphokinase